MKLRLQRCMLLRSAIVQYIQNIGIVSYFNPLLLVVSGYVSLTSQKTLQNWYPSLSSGSLHDMIDA